MVFPKSYECHREIFKTNSAELTIKWNIGTIEWNWSMIEWNRGHHQIVFLFRKPLHVHWSRTKQIIIILLSSSSSSIICLWVYNKFKKKIYSRFLGEKTSGNHHAIREATWRSQATRKSVNEWRNSQVSFLTRIILSICKILWFFLIARERKSLSTWQ